MKVTIDLEDSMIEKLEKFREKEVAQIESLIARYEEVVSKNNVERTTFLTDLVDSVKKLPMDRLLFRYLL